MRTNLKNKFNRLSKLMGDPEFGLACDSLPRMLLAWMTREANKYEYEIYI